MWFLVLNSSKRLIFEFLYYGPEHVGFETMWILYLLGMALNRAVSIPPILTTLFKAMFNVLCSIRKIFFLGTYVPI